VHANDVVTFPTSDPLDMAALTEAERGGLAPRKRFQDDGSAYMQVAGSRPSTIAQLLADPPAGQLGWIVEKYRDWTDESHDLPEQAIDRDQMLANVRIYGFTDTARSVANYYHERFHDFWMFAPRPRSTVLLDYFDEHRISANLAANGERDWCRTRGGGDRGGERDRVRALRAVLPGGHARRHGGCRGARAR